MIGNVPIAKFAPNAMIIPTRTKCFSATFAIEAIISIALVSKKFPAVDGIVTNVQIAHCAEKQILWAVWNLLMNLLLRCVARKLTGFLSSNLAALEEKSTLIQCVFLVTGFGKRDNFAQNATFASDENWPELEAKIYLTKRPPRLNTPFAGFVQDNITLNVLEMFPDLFAKLANVELKKNALV